MNLQRQKEWFDNDAFWRELYGFMFPEKRFAEAAAEINQVLQLAKPGGKMVLDLCCGPGRWAIPLVQQGFLVTGWTEPGFSSKRPGRSPEPPRSKSNGSRPICVIQGSKPEPLTMKSLLFTSLAALLIFNLAGCGYQPNETPGEAPRSTLVQLRTRAENGDAQAQFEQGVAFLFGRLGATQDDAEAVQWFRRAAEQNHVGAQFNLGVCYHNGQGVARDDVEAVKWIRQAAEQGYAPAQLDLGHCYWNGSGVDRDDTEAVRWFRKAADQRDAKAQYNLGVCYFEGRGVQKDEAQAVSWYRAAAEQNDPDAKYSLSVCYHNGQGVAKDEVAAVRWLRQAAEQDFAPAQGDLGIRFSKGEGVPRDEAEGARWLRKAAEQNNAKAQSNLALCYVLGKGVSIDELEAYKWFSLAASQGIDSAKNNLAKLEGMLSTAQLAEGKQRVSHWLEQRQKASARTFP